MEGWSDFQFMAKLNSLKGKLRGWNKETFGDIREQKSRLCQSIERLDSLEEHGPLGE